MADTLLESPCWNLRAVAMKEADVMLRKIPILLVLVATLPAVTCAQTFAAVPRTQTEADPLGTPEMKKLAGGAVEIGWRYFEKGDYETAFRRFEMATRHDRTFAPGYYGMAYVRSVQGRLDDAIKYYRETLKYDQSYAYTFANLGYALLQKEQFPEALKMLDRALQLDPHCGEAQLSYANYYAEKQDWKRAAERANEAIGNGQRLHPEFRKQLKQHGAALKADPDSLPKSRAR